MLATPTLLMAGAIYSLFKREYRKTVLQLLLLLGLVTYMVYNTRSIRGCTIPLPDLPRLHCSERDLHERAMFIDGQQLDLKRQCGDPENPYCNLRPEGFADDYEGGFYSGLGNGEIVHFKIAPETGALTVHKVWSTTPATGSPLQCGYPEHEEQCGRPLGMHYLKKKNKLIFCDTRGLLEYNFNTALISVLAERDPDGNRIRFCNDVAITEDQQYIYFTDSSTDYARSQALYVSLDGCPTGRVMRYHTATKQLRYVTQGLTFPNGIILIDGDTNALVAETLTARIIKISLKDELLDFGVVTPFAENLPALPDNLHLIGDRIWVGFTNKRFLPFSFFDFAKDKVWLRKLIVTFLSPKQLASLEKATGSFGLIGAIDLTTGKLVRTLCDHTGKVNKVSEVFLSSSPEHQSHVFLGSWYNDHFVRLPSEYVFGQIEQAVADDNTAAEADEGKQNAF